MVKLLPDNPSQMPPDLAVRLFRIFADALGRQAYFAALQAHVKAGSKYQLSTPQLLRLAVLYDHAAAKSRNRTRRLSYLRKAEVLYRNVIEQDSSNPIAWRGLGKIAYARGKMREAERLWTHAFKSVRTLPKNMRGALGISGFFLERNMFRKAKSWSLREFRLLRDFGSAAGCYIVFCRLNDLKQAKRFARITRHLMRKELAKPQYRQFDASRSRFFVELQEKIAKTERAR